MNRFKKYVSVACGAAVILTTVSGLAKTMEFTIGSTDFYVSDGAVVKQQIETAPYTENGRTMVPVRIVSENFGADVTWVEETSSVIIEDNGKKIELTIGSNEAIVNGEIKTLDVDVCEINGRTMIPLRFVSEELGKNVEYVEPSEQILISDEKPVMTVNGQVFTIDDYEFAATMSGYGADAATWNSHVSQHPDMMKSLIEQLNAILKESAVLSAEAEANGLVPEDKTELYDVVSQLNEIKDDAIYPYALLAPGVKLYEKRFNAQGIVNSMTDVEYADKELEEYYNSEFVRAKHILIAIEEEGAEKARATAETVLKTLKSGGDFAKMSEKYNDDPGAATQPDGYIFSKGEMVKEFEDAAFSLKEGEMSGIVETDYGYHIIKREKLPEYDETMKQDIAAAKATAELQKYYNEKMNKAKVEMNMSTDEILKAMGK